MLFFFFWLLYPSGLGRFLNWLYFCIGYSWRSRISIFNPLFFFCGFVFAGLVLHWILESMLVILLNFHHVQHIVFGF